MEWYCDDPKLTYRLTATPIAGGSSGRQDTTCESPLCYHLRSLTWYTVKDEIMRLQAIASDSEKARTSAEVERALAEDKLSQMQALVSFIV